MQIVSGDFAEQLASRLSRGLRLRRQLDSSPGLEHTADFPRPHCPRGFAPIVNKLEDVCPHVKFMGYLIALSFVKKSSGKPQIEIGL